MKISVIVPVYNIVEYLERAVLSIQNQTYTNIEILLVDNGSSDGSEQLVDELAEKDDRIISMHVASKGVSFARLEGVKASTGEWIGFVDGDDVIEPDMYETLIKNAKKYSAQISHCGYQMVLPNHIDYYYNTGRLIQQDNFTGIKDLLDSSFVEPGLWNKLFHKTLFHSLLCENLMDLSIKHYEDLLMNYYLFKESQKSVFEDKCLYHYIIRKKPSNSDRIYNKYEDAIKVHKIIIRDIEARDSELLNTAYRKLAWLYCLGASSVTESKQRKKYRTELKLLLPIIQRKNNGRLFVIKCYLSCFLPALYRIMQLLKKELRKCEER